MVKLEVDPDDSEMILAIRGVGTMVRRYQLPGGNGAADLDGWRAEQWGSPPPKHQCSTSAIRDRSYRRSCGRSVALPLWCDGANRSLDCGVGLWGSCVHTVGLDVCFPEPVTSVAQSPRPAAFLQSHGGAAMSLKSCPVTLHRRLAVR